jgi:hypothetical protein
MRVPFKFEFHGELIDAEFIFFLDNEGYERFRVNLPTGESYVLARFGLDPRIWTQAIHSMTEYNYPHDYVQVVGKGIDEAILKEDEPEDYGPDEEE